MPVYTRPVDRAQQRLQRRLVLIVGNVHVGHRQTLLVSLALSSSVLGPNDTNDGVWASEMIDVLNDSLERRGEEPIAAFRLYLHELMDV